MIMSSNKFYMNKSKSQWGDGHGALGRVDLSADAVVELQPGKEWALNTWWQGITEEGSKHKEAVWL